MTDGSHDDADALVTSSDGRGRDAEIPAQIPWKGWKDILRRTIREATRDNIGILSAGVAFYAVLSIFPLLGAAVATYGLLATRETASEHIQRLYELVPGDAAKTIAQRVEALVETDGATLGTGLVVSLLFALFSGSRGVDALFTGIHVAYDEPRSRPIWAQRLLALALTIVGVVIGISMLFLVAGAPSVMDWMRLETTLRVISEIVRHMLLVSGVTLGLSVLYRYGPKRRRARWTWVTPGALVGSALWLTFSYGFSFYVSTWGDYEGTYGAVGGVIVLMIWLYISAFAVLLGAEFDAELEAQTFWDTTVGAPKPIGRRGAVKADVIGEVASDPSSFSD